MQRKEVSESSIILQMHYLFLCFHTMLSLCAARELLQQLMQTNVDDNQNDLKVASYMSPSDGSAMSDSPVCNECDRPYIYLISLLNRT